MNVAEFSGAAMSGRHQNKFAMMFVCQVGGAKNAVHASSFHSKTRTIFSLREQVRRL